MRQTIKFILANIVSVILFSCANEKSDTSIPQPSNLEEMGYTITDAPANVINIISQHNSKTRSLTENPDSIQEIKVIKNITDLSNSDEIIVAVAKKEPILINDVEDTQYPLIDPYTAYVIQNDEVIGTVSAKAKQIDNNLGEIAYYADDGTLLGTVTCDKTTGACTVTANAQAYQDPQKPEILIRRRQSVWQCIKMYYSDCGPVSFGLWVGTLFEPWVGVGVAGFCCISSGY